MPDELPGDAAVGQGHTWWSKTGLCLLAHRQKLRCRCLSIWDTYLLTSISRRNLKSVGAPHQAHHLPLFRWIVLKCLLFREVALVLANGFLNFVT